MSNDQTYTVSVLRANLAALIFSIPIILISVILFVLFWSWEIIYHALDIQLIYILMIIIPGIFLHEFLHGFIWSLFAKNGWKSIHFGLKWSSLTPYCHCKEPLLKTPYVLGTIMPFFMMGFLPIIVSLIIGKGVLLLLGNLFAISAGGDLFGIWMLRKARKESWIQDHPDEIGFIILKD